MTEKWIIHYAGGLRWRDKRGAVCIRLTGWPACVAGDKAHKIRDAGQQVYDRANVTCGKCAAMYEYAENHPAPEPTE